MQTHYGKPMVRGNFRLITAWESSGVLFHNPRCLIQEKEVTLEVYPFYQLSKAMDRLVTISQ